MTEAVIDGETGVAVAGESPSAIADAVRSLLADRDQLETLGRQAQRRARSELTWGDCARKYDDILRRAIGST